MICQVSSGQHVSHQGVESHAFLQNNEETEEGQYKNLIFTEEGQYKKPKTDQFFL
jgi:anti-sigma factor ChrR (cupin superfamily)